MKHAMTLDISPEQEKVIGEAIRNGLIDSADQAVEIGVRAIRLRLQSSSSEESQAENLADLFAASPFAGLNMDFARDPEPGRGVAL